MSTLLIIIICIIVLTLIAWRFFSNRISLPCPAWLSSFVEMDNPFVKVHHAKNIIENLNITPGMSVLDAGCGPGRLTIPAAFKVGPTGSVTAMDIQEGMLEKVKEKAQKNNLKNIEFVRAGLGENKLANNKFDRAILVTVLGEIPNREAALQEIYNALKPGGILSITEIIFDIHFLQRNTVTTLAESVGFIKSKQFGNAIGYTVLFTRN